LGRESCAQTERRKGSTPCSIFLRQPYGREKGGKSLAEEESLKERETGEEKSWASLFLRPERKEEASSSKSSEGEAVRVLFIDDEGRGREGGRNLAHGAFIISWNRGGGKKPSVISPRREKGERILHHS